MILLISPAKSLNLSNEVLPQVTFPDFLPQSQKLINKLKRKSIVSLQKLMGISNALAKENQLRYKTFTQPFTKENTKPAVFAFAGDVYRGLDIRDFAKNELLYAQKHLRILSGLYGLLRPLDGIQAYRLEMGSRLKIGKTSNLYQFWGDDLTNKVNQELNIQEESVLINLASKEYFRAIDESKINGNTIHITFKEMRNERLTFISFNAKKARGLMCRFAAKNNISNPQDLQNFNYEKYSFDRDISSEKEYVFTR